MLSTYLSFITMVGDRGPEYNFSIPSKVYSRRSSVQTHLFRRAGTQSIPHRYDNISPGKLGQMNKSNQGKSGAVLSRLSCAFFRVFRTKGLSRAFFRVLMFLPPDIWVCEKCGHQIQGHHTPDQRFAQYDCPVPHLRHEQPGEEAFSGKFNEA